MIHAKPWSKIMARRYIAPPTATYGTNHSRRKNPQSASSAPPYFGNMTHDFLHLPAFTCIGLEREDLLATCKKWVPQLWVEFLLRSHEIQHLERLGIWGVMSDSEIFLAPWGGKRGRYLASWRVPVGTQPFGDWKTWEIPAQNWMRIPCRIDQIGKGLEYAQKAIRNSPEWCWDGTVHELYPESFQNPATDDICLMLGLQPR